MKPPACAAPLYRGPMKGQSATGTSAGFMRHHRAGETPCDPCLEAKRQESTAKRNLSPERAREASRRWRSRNREKHAAWNRAWLEANRDKHRAKKWRRRAREQSALTIPFTDDQLHARMSMFGHACWMCGGPFEAVDHVKPLAAGGAHCLSNLRPACTSCNSRKWARWPLTMEAA